MTNLLQLFEFNWLNVTLPLSAQRLQIRTFVQNQESKMRMDQRKLSMMEKILYEPVEDIGVCIMLHLKMDWNKTQSLKG